MPVAHFHLVDDHYPPDRVRSLLERASQLYAEVLGSPVDRVRVFAVRYRAEEVATGGTVVAAGGAAAPFFTAIVLAGRPEEQRHALLAGFTDLLVEELGCPRELVRGRIEQVDPADWGIAGGPASSVRSGEIAARQASGRD